MNVSSFSLIIITTLYGFIGNCQSEVVNYESEILTIPLYVELIKFINGNFIVVDRGTAFCYEENNKIYLASNWHVFSGRDLNGDNIIRDSVEFEGETFKNVTTSDPDYIDVYFHKTENSIYRKTYSLKNKTGDKLWMAHNRENNYDLALLKIKLSELPLDSLIITTVKKENIAKINNINKDETYKIIGYPRGRKSYHEFPVEIESKLLSNVKEKHQRLIYHAKTERGMSGSPILSINSDLSYKVIGIHSSGINDSLKIGYLIEEINNIIKSNTR